MGRTLQQEIGEWGEQKAVEFLERRGYKIVDRNIQIKKGEIDIIAWHEKKHHGKTLCFIEVKTRTYGIESGARATQGQKLIILCRTAHYYCMRKKIDIDLTPIQFEQVSVFVNKKASTVKFRLYEILE